MSLHLTMARLPYILFLTVPLNYCNENHSGNIQPTGTRQAKLATPQNGNSRIRPATYVGYLSLTTTSMPCGVLYRLHVVNDDILVVSSVAYLSLSTTSLSRRVLCRLPVVNDDIPIGVVSSVIYLSSTTTPLSRRVLCRLPGVNDDTPVTPCPLSSTCR